MSVASHNTRPPLAWFVPPPLYSAQVGFCADEEDEIRLLDLGLHPHRPSSGRSGVVLIYPRFDTVGAESVGKRSYSILVLRRIVDCQLINSFGA